MTVAASYTETVYSLVGAALGPFNTVWPYNNPSDVQIWLDPGTGIFTELEQGGGLCQLASNASTVSGGIVMLSVANLAGAVAWADGAQLAIARRSSNDQPSSFGDTSDFDPTTSENALDHIAAQVQELRQHLNRTLCLSWGDKGFYTPAASARQNAVIAFDAQGQPYILTIQALLAPVYLRIDQALAQIALATGSPINLPALEEALKSDGFLAQTP